jgi:hypothetical protein
VRLRLLPALFLSLHGSLSRNLLQALLSQAAFLILGFMPAVKVVTQFRLVIPRQAAAAAAGLALEP